MVEASKLGLDVRDGAAEFDVHGKTPPRLSRRVLARLGCPAASRVCADEQSETRGDGTMMRLQSFVVNVRDPANTSAHCDQGENNRGGLNERPGKILYQRGTLVLRETAVEP